MSKLITEYVVMILCKRYGLCACFIHQQEVYGDKQQFDNSGSTVVNKLLPSIDKLGDNKLVSRDSLISMCKPMCYKFKKLKFL